MENGPCRANDIARQNFNQTLSPWVLRFDNRSLLRPCQGGGGLRAVAERGSHFVELAFDSTGLRLLLNIDEGTSPCQQKNQKSPQVASALR